MARYSRDTFEAAFERLTHAPRDLTTADFQVLAEFGGEELSSKAWRTHADAVAPVGSVPPTAPVPEAAPSSPPLADVMTTAIETATRPLVRELATVKQRLQALEHEQRDAPRRARGALTRQAFEAQLDATIPQAVDSAVRTFEASCDEHGLDAATRAEFVAELRERLPREYRAFLYARARAFLADPHRSSDAPTLPFDHSLAVH
jgi:hypothetical protein